MKRTWATQHLCPVKAVSLYRVMGPATLPSTENTELPSSSYLEGHDHKLRSVPLLLRRKVQVARQFGKHQQVLGQGPGQRGQAAVQHGVP